MSSEATKTTETTDQATEAPVGAQVIAREVPFIPTRESLDARDIQRIYLPLDGEEVIKAILAHIERQLRNEGKLLSHITFEEVIWQFQVNLGWTGYDPRATSMRVEGKGAMEEEVKDKDKGDKVEAQVAISGQQRDKTMAPDEIREKTNQPIPVLQKGASGQGTTVRVDPRKLHGGRK